MDNEFLSLEKEINSQINKLERTGCFATYQEAQKIIDLLGGNLKITKQSNPGAVAHYITLLALKKFILPVINSSPSSEVQAPPCD